MTLGPFAPIEDRLEEYLKDLEGFVVLKSPAAGEPTLQVQASNLRNMMTRYYNLRKRTNDLREVFSWLLK